MIGNKGGFRGTCQHKRQKYFFFLFSFLFSFFSLLTSFSHLSSFSPLTKKKWSDDRSKPTTVTPPPIFRRGSRHFIFSVADRNNHRSKPPPIETHNRSKRNSNDDGYRDPDGVSSIWSRHLR